MDYEDLSYLSNKESHRTFKVVHLNIEGNKNII